MCYVLGSIVKFRGLTRSWCWSLRSSIYSSTYRSGISSRVEKHCPHFKRNKLLSPHFSIRNAHSDAFLPPSPKSGLPPGEDFNPRISPALRHEPGLLVIPYFCYFFLFVEGERGRKKLIRFLKM